jgi:hypothetical protein
MRGGFWRNTAFSTVAAALNQHKRATYSHTPQGVIPCADDVDTCTTNDGTGTSSDACGALLVQFTSDGSAEHLGFQVSFRMLLPPSPPPAPLACVGRGESFVRLTLDAGQYPADVRWHLARVGTAAPLIEFNGEASAGLVTGRDKTERWVQVR